MRWDFDDLTHPVRIFRFLKFCEVEHAQISVRPVTEDCFVITALVEPTEAVEVVKDKIVTRCGPENRLCLEMNLTLLPTSEDQPRCETTQSRPSGWRGLNWLRRAHPRR